MTGKRSKRGGKRERKKKRFFRRGWGEKEGEKEENKENVIGKYDRERRNGKKGSGKKYKIGFWNVVGMKNKEGNFRKKLKKWNVMFLSKTWLQKKRWEKMQK